ncbi:hypothetical protein [Oceanobacillus oncorhynchi]|uniref:hypothetical protein n=1 Tax=Oceanobacillus oncorhynchi TaxID=545501 RepID=UPI0034D46C0F
MKGSEALIRAIANVGGEIPATKIEEWLGQLVKADLLEMDSREDDNAYYYKLTESAIKFLEKKGVEINIK